MVCLLGVMTTSLESMVLHHAWLVAKGTWIETSGARQKAPWWWKEALSQEGDFGTFEGGEF